MEDMSYEVNLDLLVGYANTLLVSPKDKQQAKLDIVAVQVVPTETGTILVANVKGKKKKSDEKSLVIDQKGDSKCPNQIGTST